MNIKPVQVQGKGWDVTLPDGGMLCNGRAPYTLAQAQVAADNARRDYARHGAGAFKSEEATKCN
tara:strand:- start:87 stop:278 length:192 start_codon:yes stop_codon:yes gene_type:complete